MIVRERTATVLMPTTAERLLAALVLETRPHQWVKNLACFAGVIFSMQLFDATALGRSMVGFVAFCLASSAIYLLNDFFDRERDRHNPRTARRPLASGELPIGLAAAAFVVLASLSVGLAWQLGEACLLTLLAYGGLNILYSLRLKRAVIADVMCIALGFVCRVVFGVYVVEVKPTAWVVLCMFFLALFLGFGKRRAELAAQNREPADARPVLRNYTAGFLDMVLAVSAALTILCYALFTVASQRNPTLVVTVVPVVYCVALYLLQVVVHGRGEAPDRLLLSDRRIWAGVGVWLALCVTILYTDLRLFTRTADLPHGPARHAVHVHVKHGER
jgi:4-hydroxybenzoate polyprenyltransferase